MSQAQLSLAAPTHQSPSTILGLSFVIGLVLGVLTLALQKLLPNDVVQLANSGAVWVIVAFMIGRTVRSRKIAMIAGLLAVVGEVLGYYAAAYVADLMDISTGTLAVIGVWVAIGLVAGPLFAAGGSLSKQGTGLIQSLGTAALGAIFIGEGLYLMTIQPTPNTGLLWLAIAAAITLILTWRNRKWAQIWLATIGLGLVFFGCEQILVLLDQFRAQSFQ